jgi:hypothetical protein
MVIVYWIVRIGRRPAKVPPRKTTGTSARGHAESGRLRPSAREPRPGRRAMVTTLRSLLYSTFAQAQGPNTNWVPGRCAPKTSVSTRTLSIRGCCRWPHLDVSN